MESISNLRADKFCDHQRNVTTCDHKKFKPNYPSLQFSCNCHQTLASNIVQKFGKTKTWHNLNPQVALSTFAHHPFIMYCTKHPFGASSKSFLVYGVYVIVAVFSFTLQFFSPHQIGQASSYDHHFSVELVNVNHWSKM